MKMIKQASLGIALAALSAGVIVAKSKKTKPTPTIEEKIMTLKELESGLQYEILQEAAGDAESPVTGNQVEVHYTGWLDENGKQGAKFDSSVDRGQPFKFTVGVGQVIRGWDKGVLGMKVGEKRRLVIAPELA